MYKVMLVVTLALLGSAVICGMWLRFSGQKVDAAALDFHMGVALLAVASTVITLFLKR